MNVTHQQSREWFRLQAVRVTVLMLGWISLQSPREVFGQSVEDQYQAMRDQMVTRYIEAEGVSNPAVLAAMRKVPRHEFMLVPTRRYAYEDGAYPIGQGQTISPPFIVAYMTESLEPQRSDRVLEIGTGSGYQAAVLSEIVREVYSIEIVAPLGRSAAKRLKQLNYDNVFTRIGDGYQGWPEKAPFDKIIVTCSPESVPEPLVRQLKEGGRMIIPLGERYQQVFYLFEKHNGRLEPKKLIPTLFVPMTGASEDRRKVQPNPLLPEIVNPSFEIDSNDDQLTDSWHYQRQTEILSEDAPDGDHFIRFSNGEPGAASQMLQGMAIEGRALGRIRIRLWVRYQNARNGTRPGDRPGLVVHFYDDKRRPLGDQLLGPWIGTQDWERTSQVFDVPPAAQEMIIRVGLNGGTGQVDVDGLELERQLRQ